MTDAQLASTHFQTLGAAYASADPVVAEDAFRRALQLEPGVPAVHAHAFPKRERVARASEDELIGVGFSTRKAEYVLQRARLPEQSHSGKNLREILQTLPRDELFQTSEPELFETCMAIRALRDRNQLRLFLRRDRYGRF